MTRRLMLVLILLCPAFVHGAEEEVDYLSLAALMVRDGHFERALEALNKVDTKRKGLDLKRFHTLRGLVNLERGAYADAVEGFAAAIAAGQEDPVVHVYLAQAYFGRGEFPQVIEELDAAGEAASTRPATWHLRARTHWELSEEGLAWQTLGDAEALFPDDRSFPRQKIFMLIELGLYQEAAGLGAAFIAGGGKPDVADLLAIGTAFASGSQPERALPFLERARLDFPNHEQTALALARVYGVLGRYRIAAQVLERAAIDNEALLLDAAELYRRAGDTVRATFLNARAGDQPKKLTQRLALLLDSGQLPAAAAMEAALSRAGLMDDQKVRYALAYAHFKSGNFPAVEAHLDHVSRPELFRKATELRKAMVACQDAHWMCL